MNLKNSRPCGDFRTSYHRDMSMFDDKKGFYLTCLGILFLAAFVDGFMRAIGIIPPFLNIDINLMNQVIDRVKDEVIKVIP